MSWFEETPEQLLKSQSTEKRSWTFPLKKTGVKNPEIKFDVVFTERKPNNFREFDGLGEVAVPKTLVEWRKKVAESPSNYETLSAYCDALNCGSMTNPCPAVLNSMHNVLKLPVQPISGVSMIGTSYLKLWELLHHFTIIPESFSCGKTDPCMVSASIGDNPGGFAQALIQFRRRKFPDQFAENKVTGLAAVTSNKKETSTPAINKFLELYSAASGKIKIFHPTEIEGGVINPKATAEYIKIFSKEKADVVVANAGISLDPKRLDSRGLRTGQILFAEVFVGLSVQKKGGSAVYRLLGEPKPIEDILYLLHLHYEEIAIVKPVTTRIQSMERYVICSRFEGVSQDLLKRMESVHNKWFTKDPSGGENEIYATQILKNISGDFGKHVHESESYIFSFQEPVLSKSLKLLKKSKATVLPELKKQVCKGILFSVDWLVTNDVFLKKEYFLLRAPKRLPFQKDHPCHDLYPIEVKNASHA